MSNSLTHHRILIFDIYGTLIDWERGILSALDSYYRNRNQTLTPTLPPEDILNIFHDLERSQQSLTPELPYSGLLARIFPSLVRRLHVQEHQDVTIDMHLPSESECIAFGESVGSWPAFRDSVAALRRLRRKFKLVVLSNVDRGSFERTNRSELGLHGVSFDLVVTAQDLGCYKPELRAWERALELVKGRFGVRSVEEQVLVVAQSQWHDHRPARRLGVRSVWIVRPGAIMGNVREGEEVYDWRFDSLGEMADAVEREE